MPQPPDPNGVFLNIPYDEAFRPLYLAYIVGLAAFGFVPHLTAEITSSERRLDRIFRMLQSCRYSIHDLSRVEVPPSSESVPRFNMPIELGMAISLNKLRPKTHNWIVCESTPYRLQRSASDLNGTDPLIHDGSPEGVLRELSNLFRRPGTPSFSAMLNTYQFLEGSYSDLLEKNGTHTPYNRNVLNDLYLLSKDLVVLMSPKK